MAIVSGSATAEMTEDEDPAKKLDLRENGFPVVLKKQRRSVVIESWQTLADFCESRPSGVSLLDHLLTHKIVGSKRPLMIGSLTAPEIVPYLAAYRLAASKFVHGYLYPGEFRDQPNVLIEAFAVIEGEIQGVERRQMQAMKREQQRMAAEAKDNRR